MIGPLRPQPISRDGRLAQALTLAPPPGDPQALFTPEPLHALAVDVMAKLGEADMRAAIAPARPRGRDLPQQHPPPLVAVNQIRPVALRGPVLAGDSARP